MLKIFFQFLSSREQRQLWMISLIELVEEKLTINVIKHSKQIKTLSTVTISSFSVYYLVGTLISLSNFSESPLIITTMSVFVKYTLPKISSLFFNALKLMKSPL